MFITESLYPTSFIMQIMVKWLVTDIDFQRTNSDASQETWSWSKNGCDEKRKYELGNKFAE